MNAQPTKRQRFLAAMRGQPADELVWAPNFDYWLKVNRGQGTMPEACRDMSRDNIVRAIGATIWNRAGGFGFSHDPSIKHTRGPCENGNWFHEITTPLGTIREEYAATESEHSTPACVKHYVTDRESLRVMTYVVEGSFPTFDPAPAAKAIEETGDDGIVLHMIACVPFIQFAKSDAGYMNAYYLMEDFPDEVNRLIAAHHRNTVEAIKLLAASPADVVSLGDNMDELTMPPNLFERYAIGFYQDCKRALAGSGKIFEAHWCGRTQHLLPLLPQTGIDVVEAVVTEPMAGITLAAALDILDNKVVLQGGIPSILVCPGAVSQRGFEQYIESIILPQKGRPGFILGMSDIVPPDADFSRVEIIAKLIR